MASSTFAAGGKLKAPNETSLPVTKTAGGTVEVTDISSTVLGAKIEIPADPHPDRPDSFTPETAIPINDPADTNDSLWEDTTITIGYRENPPPMSVAEAAGPAVHFGPYRTFINRDVNPGATVGKVGVSNNQFRHNYLT